MANLGAIQSAPVSAVRYHPVPAPPPMMSAVSLPYRRETIAVDAKHGICINHFLPADGNHIFNEPAYFKLHSDSSDDVYAQLVRTADSKVCATISFYESSDKVFVSPKRGTFGGLGLNCPVDAQTVERFLLMLFDHLRASGAREIDVKGAPFSHDLALSSLVSNILLRRGAIITSQELSYDMAIDARPFSDRIDSGNSKRIRKCVREGFIAEQIDVSGFEDAYNVIRDNRIRRGYPVSMTVEQLGTMVETFPERLHFFAVFPNSKKSRIVAAAVCIAVSSSVLYVFYWGDAEDMSSYSPIAMLASRIYEFCQQQDFQLLDVGTSTLGGEPNHGLINFKRNLGFSESLKLSFACRL